MIRKTMTAALIAAFVSATPIYATLEMEQAEERANRESAQQDLYDAATESLDEHEWSRAAQQFREVAQMGGNQADAALYWLAYSQHKMAQRSDALATIVDLQRRFPKSRWAEDAKALEVEIRQSAGQRVAPESVSDDELKLVAVSGLMHTDPERAIPILEKIISGNHTPKLKEKAIFVLSQSGSPRAMEMLARLARDGSRPELQSRAIRNLGILGGDRSRILLKEIYVSSNDVKIRKSILKSYMISGDRVQLLVLAKGEQNPELRGEAIQQLGILGAKSELSELYIAEPAVPLRKKIIHAMFLGGNSEKLAELAQREKVLELRLAAIKSLGLMGNANTTPVLVSLYEADPSLEVKKAVIHALFLQSNGKALVALARKEKNPAMKKEIVSKLALVGGDDTADFLMEIINQ